MPNKTINPGMQFGAFVHINPDNNKVSYKYATEAVYHIYII